MGAKLVSICDRLRRRVWFVCILLVMMCLMRSGVAYSSRFTMPSPPPQYAPLSTGRNNNNNLWYSYDYGSIHFVMMSTGLLLDEQCHV